jgi:hypothetical protein
MKERSGCSLYVVIFPGAGIWKRKVEIFFSRRIEMLEDEFLMTVSKFQLR